MTSIAQNPNTQMLNSFLADSEIQEMLVEQGEGVPAKKFVKDDDLIDKKRFITSFGRQNFNIPLCLLELLQNIVDAKGTKMDIIRELINIFWSDEKQDTIRFVDNGKGMDEEKLYNSIKFHGANHEDDKSVGLAGIGGKAAQLNLSGWKWSQVITSPDGVKIWSMDCDWKTLNETGQASKSIAIRPANEQEKELFLKERKENANPTGTTITIPFDKKRYDKLKQLITNPKECSAVHYRPDIMSSGNDMVFRFIDNVKKENNTMKKIYNYMATDKPNKAAEFVYPVYQDKHYKHCQIRHFKDKRTHAVLEILFTGEDLDEMWEIGGKKRLAKEPKRFYTNIVDNLYSKDDPTGKYEELCEPINIYIGCRYSSNFWNKSEREYLGSSGGSKKCLSPYDEEFFDDLDDEWMASLKVFRNKMMLAPIKQKNVGSSARANRGSRLLQLVQVYIHVSTEGKDGNYVDTEIIQTNQNKGEERTNDLPVRTMRLIAGARKQYRDELEKEFKRIAKFNHDEYEAEQAALKKKEEEEELVRQVELRSFIESHLESGKANVIQQLMNNKPQEMHELQAKMEAMSEWDWYVKDTNWKDPNEKKKEEVLTTPPSDKEDTDFDISSGSESDGSSSESDEEEELSLTEEEKEKIKEDMMKLFNNFKLEFGERGLTQISEYQSKMYDIIQ